MYKILNNVLNYKLNDYKVKLIDYEIKYYDFNNEKLRLNENIKIMNYNY